MRKVLFMLLALLALTGCKEKHEKLIDEYLEAHLKDPDSYQNIKLGKPDLITPMSMAIAECLERKKTGEFSFDTINVFLDHWKQHLERSGINPYDTLGWEVSHRYRAKNSFGATDIVEVVYTFDKNMNRITEARQK